MPPEKAPKKKKPRQSRRDNGVPSVRSLTPEPVRSLIPRKLTDEQTTIWLAGYYEGERRGAEDAWDRAAAAARQLAPAAAPSRGTAPGPTRGSRPAIDPSRFATERAPTQLAQPDEIAGEDPDRDDELPDESSPEPDDDADESELSLDFHTSEKGPSGVFPKEFEESFIKYYEDCSTNARRAREIVITVFQTKVEPDANGMPPKSVGDIVWRAMINEKIAKGVERDGFVDHHMGRMENLSDGEASEAAGRMDMSRQAAEHGL